MAIVLAIHFTQITPIPHLPLLRTCVAYASAGSEPLRMNQTHPIHGPGLLDRLMPYLCPRHPGRHRNTILAVLLGFMLGPLGVCLYLRSLLDFLASIAFAILLRRVCGLETIDASTVAGTLWAAGRVIFDKHTGTKTATHDSPSANNPSDSDEPLFAGGQATA